MKDSLAVASIPLFFVLSVAVTLTFSRFAYIINDREDPKRVGLQGVILLGCLSLGQFVALVIIYYAPWQDMVIGLPVSSFWYLSGIFSVVTLTSGSFLHIFVIWCGFRAKGSNLRLICLFGPLAFVLGVAALFFLI